MYNRYIHTTQTNYGVVTQTRNVVVWHYYYKIECITTIAFHLSVYPAHKIVAVTFMVMHTRIHTKAFLNAC